VPACTLEASHKGGIFVMGQRFRSSGRRRAALATAMTSAALLGTTLIAVGPAQAGTGNGCAN